MFKIFRKGHYPFKERNIREVDSLMFSQFPLVSSLDSGAPAPIFLSSDDWPICANQPFSLQLPLPPSCTQCLVSHLVSSIYLTVSTLLASHSHPAVCIHFSFPCLPSSPQSPIPSASRSHPITCTPCLSFLNYTTILRVSHSNHHHHHHLRPVNLLTPLRM